MEKELTAGQIAMAFTGSFLGAGFVSGQELTQFFAAFGVWGLAWYVPWHCSARWAPG